MAEKKKKESSLKIFFAALLIMLFFIIIFYFLFFYFKPLETKIVEVKFSVADHPAFDLNSSSLIFGKVPPGSSAVRNVILENKYGFPIEVKVFASRNIARFLQADSSLTIGALNTSRFPVNLRVPNNADFGNYSGKIMFEIRKMRA